MTTKTQTQTQHTTLAPNPTTTRVLLAGGAVAGPLFLLVVLLQVITRGGFDITRHHMSLLSLGEWGWIQAANFVVNGLLFVLGAVGMRRVLHPGRAGTWGPLLIGVFGASLVLAGLFPADPVHGFPLDGPALDGEPTWQGMVHNIAPAVSFLALIAACFVLARRYFGLGRRNWAVACALTGVALFIPDLFLTRDWYSLALALGAVVGWGWASLMAARLLIGTGPAQ